MSYNYSFLGENITHWAQSIRRGYAISFLLYSFHESGVFDSLKSLKAKSANQIAKEKNLNFEIAANNLFNINSQTVNSLNPVELISAEKVVFTVDAINSLAEALA